MKAYANIPRAWKSGLCRQARWSHFPEFTVLAQFEQRRTQRLGHAPRLQMLVSDHVAGEEREHGADLVARGIAILVAVERRDLPNLEVVACAAGGFGSGEDVRARIADVVSGEAIIGERAVGGPASSLQRLRMRGGEKDRRRALDPRQMRACRAKGRGLTLQQRLDERHALRELARARLRQPDILGAAVAGTDAQHGASVRHVVKRGDRGRGDRGMPGEQIGDADRNARAARGARDHRRRHPWIHGVSRRVGNADHGIAVAIGALGELLAQVKRVGPEEETNLHVALSMGYGFMPGARSLAVFLEKRRPAAASYSAAVRAAISGS